MDLEELMEALYQIYEKDCECDGEVLTNVMNLDFDGERVTLDVKEAEK